MNGTLSTRLMVWVGGPTALLFAGLLLLSSHRGLQRVLAQTEESARGNAKFYAARLDASLSKASKIPEMVALNVENGRLHTGPEIEAYLRGVVAGCPEIYGSCLAFEPESFLPGERFYAPYFYRQDGQPKFVQLGNPDYNYFKWEWYDRPKKLGQAIWTEPYFDDGGGETLMTTRSVPFRRDGAFWGIATIDIALNQLVAEAKSIQVARSGYAFVVSQQGRFVAFPDPTKIMKSGINDTNPELARMLAAGQEGFRKTREPLRGGAAWIAFAPMQNGGFALALVYPESEVLASAAALQLEQRLLAGAGVLALFAALFVVARSISRPLTELAAAAQQVAEGNLEQRLAVNAPTEEVRHLTFAFNKMTRDLQMRMQELRYTTTVKERVEGELNAARNIQMSLLPRNFPVGAEGGGVEIHALVKPAREVGGDFYDFYLTGDDWFCFFIGDVSGKGVPAALFMAVTKTLLKASSSRPGAAGEMLARVNNELCQQTDSGMFVSLLYGLLDLRSGALELGNAGHPSPFILSARGAVTPMDTQRNVALGAVAQLTYRITHAQLAPGDALFLYTDGVTEALNNDRHFYTPARLQIALKDLAALPVEKITRGVVQDVRAFSAEREQSDDISVLAVRWPGPLTPTTPT